MNKAIKNRGFESYKKLAVSFVAFTFLLNQVAFAAEPIGLQQEYYAQTKTLAEVQKSEPVSAPLAEEQTTQAFYEDSLTLTPVSEKTEKLSEVNSKTDYDYEEYSFADAIAHLNKDYASAVIVKNITSEDLKALVNHEDGIEIGLAVVEGKPVLFTIGNKEEIRMNEAAEKILSRASLIAHTHPAGKSGQPSLEDFNQAGESIEYVIGDQGVYAYNKEGLTSEKPLAYSALVYEIQKRHEANESTVETRQILHDFIAAIDDYNENPHTAQLFRSAGPTIFPGEPRLSSFDSAVPPAGFAVVQQNDPTQVDNRIRILHNTYNTTNGSFGGSIIAFSTPANLNAESKFTFDLRTDNNTPSSCNGQPNCVKIEFVDSSNRVAAIFATNITSVFKQYDILRTTLNVSNPNVDYTQIKQINFVIDHGMVSGKNNGFFDVRTGGLFFEPTFIASTGPVTNLTTNQVSITELEPQGHNTVTSFNQISTSQLSFNYNLANGADNDFSRWGGVLFNLGTSYNLSAQNLVFSLKGTGTSKVKIEVTSGSGVNAKKVTLVAQGLTGNAQFYRITNALVAQAAVAGFDATNITSVVMIVDDQSAGSKTANGTIEIASQGLRSAFIVDPDPSAPAVTTLPTTSTGARPELIAFASFNPAQSDFSNAAVTVFSQTFSQLAVNNYNATSFSGVFLNYDDPNTGNIENINLNALFPNGMVLGLDNAGTGLGQVKLEVTDVTGKTDYVILQGIENFGKRWKIAMSMFDEVNAAAIKTISLVIEGRNVDKKLSIDWGNFFFIPSLPADGSNPNITPVPAVGGDAPPLVGFASFNPNDPDPTRRDFSNASITPLSPTFQQLNMNLYNSFSYGGAFVSFDVNSMVTVLETINIDTAFPNGIVLGLDNGGTDITEVELELTDINGKRDVVKLSGIEFFGKRWKIPTSDFDEINRAQVLTMTLLVKGLHVGAQLNIDWGNFFAPQAPDLGNPQITKLPATSTGDRVIFNGFASFNPNDPNPAQRDFSNSTVTLASQTFATIDMNLYNTFSYGGGFLQYDNLATLNTVETINLNTAFPNGIVFGLDNGGTDITEALIEVRDINGNVDSVLIGGIKDFGQVWKILASQFNSVNVTQIQTISLVILGKHVAAKLNVDWGNFGGFIPALPADGSNPSITPLPLTSFDLDRPELVGFASFNPNDPDPTKRDFSSVKVAVASPTFASMDINLYNTVSFGGAFVSYDNPVTPAKEVLNLNTAFPNGLVLGLDNGGTTLTEVTLELTDAAGKRDRVRLTGIEPFGKRWNILASQFDEINVTQVTTVTLLVEGRHVGEKLNVDWGNWAAAQAPDGTNPAITKLPVTSLGTDPLAQGFASFNPNDADPAKRDFSNSTVTLASQTFATVNMNLYNTFSYGGMFLNYDNPGTANNVESINLNTAFPNGIVLGLDNGGTDVTQAVLEFRDASGKTDSVTLGNIENFGKVWKILISQLDDVNVTQIQTISLVVLGKHIGAKLNVDWGNFGGFIPPIPADGSNPNITFLPLDHNGKRVVLNGFASFNPAQSDYSNVAVNMSSATFAQLDLNLYNTDSFGGAFMSYDDFGTPNTVETINLNTAFPNGIVLGLDNGGTALTEALLEVTDITGKKASVKLVGIENFGKRWKVLASQLTGLDRTQITTISLVVLGKHVGAKLNIDWGLFDFTPKVSPDATNPAITTVPLDNGSRPVLNGFASFNPNDPDPTKRDFSNSSVTMSSATQGKISMNLFNTFSYGGAYVNYSQPINLDTAFSNGIVLGLSSNNPALTTVKLQVTDINGNRDEVTLVNVGTTTKRWKILPSLFDQVDRTKISTITLLVEGKYVGLDLNFEWGEFFFIPGV